MLITILLPAPLLAHEFWIEPARYQVETGAPLVADFRNGQVFKGVALGYFSRQSVRFDVIAGGEVTPVSPRMGDVPALSGLPAPGPGLAVLVHETAPSTVSYKTWETFQTFAEHKGFGEMRARHQARGLPTEGFSETYRRFAKALVAVGDGAGADAATGMETEFVALTNPYTDAAGPLRVRLLYRGAPRAGAQIEVFEKPASGAVTVTYLATDTAGEAAIPVKPGHAYLLDAVVLRPAPEGGEPVWESLWAALTFAVPD